MKIRVQAVNAAAPNWAPGVSRMEYSVNGHLLKAIDTAGLRTLHYINGADGQVLMRHDMVANDANGFNAASGTVTQGNMRGQRQFYYLAGQRLGDVSNEGIPPEQMDYAMELALKDNRASNDNKHRRLNAAGYDGASSSTHYANFDQNYQPINGLYPAFTPGDVTVSTGDTLKSLAQRLWGDASLWYMLADANGLQGDDPTLQLPAGMRLTVPNKVVNIHNRAGMTAPPLPGSAMGDASPTLPAPPPPPSAGKKGCGGLATVIMVAVVIVVAAYAAGAIATGSIGTSAGMVTGSAAAGTAGFSQTLSVGFSVLSGGGAVAGAGTGLSVASGLATMGVAAAGAAVGSAVGQGLASVSGYGSFSWRGVASSAISAGVTAGLGWAMQGGNAASNVSKMGQMGKTGAEAATLGTTGGSVAQAAQTAQIASAPLLQTAMFNSPTMQQLAFAASQNAISQAVSVSVGIQKHFSWRDVAAAVASSAAGMLFDAAANAFSTSGTSSTSGTNTASTLFSKATPANAKNADLFNISGLARTLAAGVASAYVRGGLQDNLTGVAWDSIGSWVGNTIAQQSAVGNINNTQNLERSNSDLYSISDGLANDTELGQGLNVLSEFGLGLRAGDYRASNANWLGDTANTNWNDGGNELLSSWNTNIEPLTMSDAPNPEFAGLGGFSDWNGVELAQSGINSANTPKPRNVRENINQAAKEFTHGLNEPNDVLMRGMMNPNQPTTAEMAGAYAGNAMYSLKEFAWSLTGAPRFDASYAALKQGDFYESSKQFYLGLVDAVTTVATGAPLSSVGKTWTGRGGNSLERLAFKPSSGVILEATKGKTTTILGSYRQDMKGIIDELGNIKSTDFGPRTNGFNVLNVPDNLYVSPKQFWTEYNQPWLGNAVSRSDTILMATKPQFGSNSMLFRVNDATGKLELSGFGKEYFFLRKNSYVLIPTKNQMVR